MADTIITTPSGDHHDSNEGMGVGMIFGIILAFLIVVALFYVYGWPAIRGEQPEPQQPDTIIVTPPNSTTTTTTTTNP